MLVATGTYRTGSLNVDFAAFEPAIDWLHERGARLVGIDTPSVDLFSAKLIAHERFLAHDMAILEGLVLDQVLEGTYELIAAACRPASTQPREGGAENALSCLRARLPPDGRSHFRHDGTGVAERARDHEAEAGSTEIRTLAATETMTRDQVLLRWNDLGPGTVYDRRRSYDRSEAARAGPGPRDAGIPGASRCLRGPDAGHVRVGKIRQAAGGRSSVAKLRERRPEK